MLANLSSSRTNGQEAKPTRRSLWCDPRRRVAPLKVLPISAREKSGERVWSNPARECWNDGTDDSRLARNHDWIVALLD